MAKIEGAQVSGLRPRLVATLLDKAEVLVLRALWSERGSGLLMEAPRLTYLDSLRGLAALAIALFWHYQHLTSAAQPYGAVPLFHIWPFSVLYWYGWMAVDFFFVLSGYVFGHVYLARVADGEVGVKEFARRRFARIYPLHLATLLVVAVLAWEFRRRAGRFPLFENEPWGLGAFGRQVLMLQGFMLSGYNAPAWSLSIEELLYVVFFVAARWGWGTYAGPALIVVGILPWLIPSFVGRGCLGFGLGLLVHWGRRWLVPALAIILIAPLMPIWRVDAGFALGLLAVLEFPSLQRLLTLRPLVALGGASLAIYLVHVPLQMAVLLSFQWLGRPVPADNVFFWLCYCVGVVAVAFVVSENYELPLRRFIRSVEI